MKRNNKLLALLSGLLIMVGLSVTSCNPDVAASFGKDYFFGTWKTTNFDSNGNRQTYYRNSDGYYYTITWKFDGKSENLFNTDGGSFRQHLINWGTTAPTPNSDGTLSGTPANETVWIGAYKLKGNSSYSRGKLFLYYEFGIDLAGEGAASGLSYNDVKDWTSVDFLNQAFGNSHGLDNLDLLMTIGDSKLKKGTAAEINSDDGTSAYVNNGVTIQVRNKAKPVCSDVEYFRFNLKDATASGYSRMMATILDKDGTTTIGKIYNQWNSAPTSGRSSTRTSYGYDVQDGCSWNKVATRCLARISVSDTGNETQWVSSDTRSNKTIFHLNDDGNSVDNSDTTDYTDTEATVADGTAEE